MDGGPACRGRACEAAAFLAAETGLGTAFMAASWMFAAKEGWVFERCEVQFPLLATSGSCCICVFGGEREVVLRVSRTRLLCLCKGRRAWCGVALSTPPAGLGNKG